MKKHFISAVLVLLLSAFFAIPCLAAAPTYGNFEYADNGDTITITTYFGSEEVVDVPAFIENKPVREIADYAFFLCNTVKTVRVPESVTTIGKEAFTGAANLGEVQIVPDSAVAEPPAELPAQTPAADNSETTAPTDSSNPKTETTQPEPSATDPAVSTDSSNPKNEATPAEPSAADAADTTAPMEIEQAVDDGDWQAPESTKQTLPAVSETTEATDSGTESTAVSQKKKSVSTMLVISALLVLLGAAAALYLKKRKKSC